MRQIIALSCAVSLVLLSGLTTCAAGATAARWPGWRGDGTAISSETQLPVRWDTQTNIVWKTRLGGEGNSSPIIKINIDSSSSISDKIHFFIFHFHSPKKGARIGPTPR